MLTPLFICVIFLLAGFIQGMTGFGSALVAIPLLSLVIDIKKCRSPLYFKQPGDHHLPFLENAETS